MRFLMSNSVVAVSIRMLCRHWRQSGACVALLVAALMSPMAHATTVRMETTNGDIDIEMHGDEVPTTVLNFLRYAGAGSYNDNWFHRSVQSAKSFGLSDVRVIQAGGYQNLETAPGSGEYQNSRVLAGTPIVNEFDLSRPNVRGTIAMARTQELDSATSEWFINTQDNPGLDILPDSIFAVFGRVLGAGMDVVDQIAAIPTYPTNPPPTRNCAFPAADSPCVPVTITSSFFGIPISQIQPFFDIPLNGYTYDTLSPPEPTRPNLVLITRVPNVVSAFSLAGNNIPYVADPGLMFDSASSMDFAMVSALIPTFPRPSGSVVSIDQGIMTFKVDDLGASLDRMIEMWDGAVTRPTHYYAYGPTQSNQAPHWYDFSYDGTTGAVITATDIELHFVDGQRGDDDLRADGSITHTGAPVTITSTTATSDNSSCSLSRTPAGISRAGDWGVVALFLAVLAGIRARRESTSAS